MAVIQKILNDRPRFHMGGTRRWDSLPETLHAIEGFVRPGDRTLETGCGVSTVVFAAGGAKHTAISPNDDEHRRIREYCRSAGIDDSGLEFIVGYSDRVLPDLCQPGSWDSAFIDGAHSFPFPTVDWHYVSSSLKVGGRLLLDDIPVPAVSQVFRFMNQEPNWRFDSVLDDRAALFTLLSDAPPEDWVHQATNKHPDYSFAPLPKRVRLELTYQFGTLRKSMAERYPGLRDTWKRVSGSRDS
jgi:hypothetical protein